MQTDHTQPRTPKTSNWQPEEFSMSIDCPVCHNRNLERIEAAGTLDGDEGQSTGALFRCRSCDHRSWFFLRWGGSHIILIANTP